METYIDWRLSSVLSLLALVCLSICCLLVSFLKLSPGHAPMRWWHAGLILYQLATVLLSSKSSSCTFILAPVSCPLADFLVLDPGQLLEGRAVEEDGNGDNPPSSSLCT